MLKYTFTVVSLKGDWPFLRSSMALNNGYNCKDKCHRCNLGLKDSFLDQQVLNFSLFFRRCWSLGW